jgi:hypothetical protein
VRRMGMKVENATLGSMAKYRRRVRSTTLGLDEDGGGERYTWDRWRSTGGAYVALHLESMRMMVGGAKLGALNLGSMAVRSTKYERRVRSSDEERERGVLRPASYTRFDSQYLGDFYSDSGKPPLVVVVVAVVAAVSRL